MAKKLALCRISDTEPLLSIVAMLESAGYDCALPDRTFRNYLRDLKCRNVDEFSDMQRHWGSEMPPSRLKEVGLGILDTCDLYVDINGCGNGPKLWDKWPRLRSRTLTYFINGGEPRNTWDKGDCQTPATPIVTTAQHYRARLWCPGPHLNKEGFSCDDPPHPRGYWQNTKLVHPVENAAGHTASRDEQGVVTEKREYICPWGCGPLKPAPWSMSTSTDSRTEKVYVHYPPFMHWDQVRTRTDETTAVSIGYGAPVSFVHNCLSWGCQAYVEPARRLGVRAYGGGNSPDGIIPHERVWDILASALCTVYLKGGGAVDYSILEPMAAGCPVTFHTSYVHNCRLYDLLIPGETCLTWETEAEMAGVLDRLRNPEYNKKIGEAGKQRMREVVWSPNNSREIREFSEWLERMFP